MKPNQKFLPVLLFSVKVILNIRRDLVDMIKKNSQQGI